MAITQQPHFSPAEAMLQRLESPPARERRLFGTVAARRNVECPHCGHYHEQTRRKVCRKCGEYIDAR